MKADYFRGFLVRSREYPVIPSISLECLLHLHHASVQVDPHACLVYKTVLSCKGSLLCTVVN